MLSLLLAVIWLPASSHVLLQSAGIIHAHDALHAHEHLAGAHHPSATPHHHHGNEEHAAADGWVRAVSGKVEVPLPKSAPSPAWLLAAGLLSVSSDIGLQPDLRPAQPAAAPPELSPSWQFSYRTALPPRAPAFAS